MLKTPHGQKRQTHRCETRTREGPHRAAPDESRASTGREGSEGDDRIGQLGRRSGYCPHQAWATAASRLADRRELALTRTPNFQKDQLPKRPTPTLGVGHATAVGNWELTTPPDTYIRAGRLRRSGAACRPPRSRRVLLARRSRRRCEASRAASRRRTRRSRALPSPCRP